MIYTNRENVYRSSWVLSWRPVAMAVFVILASLSRSSAGTVSWKITTTNSWHIGTNWFGDAVPGAGDDVVITNAGAKVYLTNAVTNVSITLGGASSGSTLVISNWDTSLTVISNVTILTNGMMTLPSAFTNTAMSNRVYIVCSNLTINGGGSINVDYQGYAGGSSTGENGNGQGYGYGVVTATNASGAGHGGLGGSSSDTNGQGAVYGSSNAPVYPGSGGGSGTNAPAGHGGGVVRISAQGTVAMAGTITANGQTPTNVSCGGGSGGSIFITCRTFTGTNGIVTASGGSADTNYCGGGGGGRIAILSYSSCFTNNTTFFVTNGASYTNDAENGSLACGVLELTRTPLNFTNTVLQGYNANSQTCQVWNAGPGIISYTISTNVSWLTVSNSVGTSTGNVDGVTNTHTVFYNTSALSPGTEQGTITISADEGGQILMIDVTLTINARGQLGVSPGFLEYTLMEGQNLTNKSTLYLWNTNSQYELGYEISTNMSWISLSSTSGTLSTNDTNTVTASYTTTNLLAGTYTGTVTVVATNKVQTGDIATGSPFDIDVTLTVNPRPRISLSTVVLTNGVMQGHDAVSQSFEVWNASGFYTMIYSISDSVPWLVTSVTSGTSTGERDTVTVSYSSMGLAVGTSNATITVSGMDSVYGHAVSNSPDTISVTLDIRPLAVLSCDTGGFTNTVRQGQSIADASFRVWNGCSDPQGVLSYTITDDMDWVSVSSIAQTNIPGQTDTITVSTDTSGLGPGTHSGTITINGVDESTGDNSIGSPKEILVELTVTETIAVDFSGDGVSDIVVYHEGSGNWYILDTATLTNSWLVRFGGIGYVPVPGDYDGDGLVELGVYKTTSGNWYAVAVGNYVILTVGGFGGTGYEPVEGDYDGDGRQDFAVYATGAGKWYVMSPDGEIIVWDWLWGEAGYSPVSGDFDGDGIDDMAVYEDATGDWYIISKEGILIAWAEGWGGSGFTPVSGDYDGDGLSDLAVYHEDTGLWFITNLNTGLIVWGMEWGGPGCTAVSGDYNGDGQSDLAVYYQGWWFIETISGTWLHYALEWGGADFIPVGM